MTPAEWEEKADHLNNVLATGGLFMFASQGGLDPELIMDGDKATNSFHVKLHFMKSRYKVTVERMPDGDPYSDMAP